MRSAYAFPSLCRLVIPYSTFCVLMLGVGDEGTESRVMSSCSISSKVWPSFLRFSSTCNLALMVDVDSDGRDRGVVD